MFDSAVNIFQNFILMFVLLVTEGLKRFVVENPLTQYWTNPILSVFANSGHYVVCFASKERFFI